MQIIDNDSTSSVPCKQEVHVFDKKGLLHCRAMYNLDGPDEKSFISDKLSATRASSCIQEESKQNQIHRKDYVSKTNDCNVEEYIAHFYRKRKILEKYLARWRQCLRDAFDRLEKADTMLKLKTIRCEEMASKRMDDVNTFPLTIPYLLAFELQRQHHCLQRNPKASLSKVSSQSNKSRPYDQVAGSNDVQLSRSSSFLQAIKIKQDVVKQNQLYSYQSSNKANPTRLNHPKPDLRLIYYAFKTWSECAKNKSDAREELALAGAKFWRDTVQHRIWMHWKRFYARRALFRRFSLNIHQSTSKSIQAKTLCGIKLVAKRRQAARFVGLCRSNRRKLKAVWDWHSNTQHLLDYRRQRDSARAIQCQRLFRLTYYRWVQFAKAKKLQRARRTIIETSRSRNAAQKIMDVWKLYTLMIVLQPRNSSETNATCYSSKSLERISLHLRLFIGVQQWKKLVKYHLTNTTKKQRCDLYHNKCLLRQYFVQCWVKRYHGWKERQTKLSDAFELHIMQLKKNSFKMLQSNRILAQNLRQIEKELTSRQRRLAAGRALRAWKYFNNRSKHLLIVHTQWKRKQMIKSIMIWKQSHSTRHLHKRRELNPLLLQSEKLSVWLRWRRTWILRCKVRHQQHLHSAFVKMKAWKIWQLHVNSTKQIRVAITAFETFSRKELCRRPFFQSWSLFAVRNRFRKEMIRLFRRKCTRRKVKQMLRRWKLRVVCSHCESALEHQTLSTTLQRWKVFALKSSQTGEYSVAADDFFRLYSCQFGVFTWKRYHTHAISFRVKSAMATKWFATRLSTKSFREWNRLTRKIKRVHQHLVAAKAGRKETLKKESWRQWKFSTGRSKQYKLSAAFMQKCYLIKSFHCWLSYTSNTHKRERTCKLTAQHYSVTMKVKILLKWHVSAFQQRRCKEMFQLKRFCLIQRSMHNAVNVWASHSKTKAFVKMNSRKAVAYYTDMLKYTAINRWHQWLFLRFSVRIKSIRLNQQMRAKRLIKAVNVWAEMRVRRVDQWKKKCQIENSMKMVHKAMSFRNWQSCAAKKSNNALAMLQWTQRRRRLQLSTTWLNWMLFIGRMRTTRQKARKMFEQHSRSIVYGVYKQWKAFRKFNVNKRQANLVYGQRLRIKVFRTWILYHQQKSPTYNKKILARQSRRAVVLRAVFSAWRRHRIDQRNFKSCIVSLQNARTKRLSFNSIRRMQRWSNLRKNQRRARFLYQIATCRRLLHKWRQRVILMNRRRDASQMICRLDSRVRSQILCSRWYKYQQCVSKARWCEAVGLHTKHVVTKSWNRWCQHSIKHKRWLAKRKRTLLHYAFQTWCAECFRKKEQSVKIETVSVVIRRIASVRVCTHWKQWTQAHQCESKQRHIATSTYCSHLINRTWACWKRFCKKSQYSYAINAEAGLIAIFRTQRHHFDKWFLYLQTRRSKTEDDSECASHIQTLRVRQIVRRWDHSISWRKQRRAQMFFAQECDRLRLLCIGVTCFAAFNEKKRRYAETNDQAGRFFVKHSRIRSFFRWLIFVQLRKTMESQVRAFENCQSRKQIRKWLYWALISKRRNRIEQVCEKYRNSTWRFKFFCRWRLVHKQAEQIKRIEYTRNMSLATSTWDKWKKMVTLNSSASLIAKTISFCCLRTIFVTWMRRVLIGFVKSKDPNQSEEFVHQSFDNESADIAARNSLERCWKIWSINMKVNYFFHRRVNVATEVMMKWKGAQYTGKWFQFAKYQSRERKILTCVRTKCSERRSQSVWSYWRDLIEKRRERWKITHFHFAHKRLRQSWKCLRSSAFRNQRMRLSLGLMRHVMVSYTFQRWKKYIQCKLAVTDYLSRRKHRERFKYWRKWITGRENRMRLRKRMEQMKEKRQSFQLFNFFSDWDDYRTGKWIFGQCEAILREQSSKRKYCSALSKWKKMMFS